MRGYSIAWKVRMSRTKMSEAINKVKMMYDVFVSVRRWSNGRTMIECVRGRTRDERRLLIITVSRSMWYTLIRLLFGYVHISYIFDFSHIVFSFIIHFDALDHNWSSNDYRTTIDHTSPRIESRSLSISTSYPYQHLSTDRFGLFPR